MRNVKSALLLLIASGAAHAEMALNLTSGVTPISQDIYHLHMMVLWICVVIGVVVFGVMFYSILFHRKSIRPKPAEFHSHLSLEIFWTIIPTLILVAMVIPATHVFLRMHNSDQEELNIKVTGYQWKWKYEYLEDGVQFFSNLSTPQKQLDNLAPKGEHYLREVDAPVVVPIHKKIRFLVTSNDVNHSWWVPDLGIKRDALPGFINEAWARVDKPGTYRGQCAELCGVRHAYMPIVVQAVTEQEYKDWVAKQKGEVTQGEADTNRPWAMKELVEKGGETYHRICAACHQPEGQGLPPTFPALKGGPIVIGPIKDHIDIVLNGKAGTAMQAFKSQLSDVELASVITFERNSWGNNKGDSVQPIQIKAIRGGQSIDEGLKVQPSANAKPAVAPLQAAAKTTATTQPQPQPPAPAAPQAPTAATVAPQAPAATTTAAPEETLAAAMTRGEKVYLSTCAACHQPTGVGMPPTFPALKGSKIVTGPLKDHMAMVLNGKPGTAMQAFKTQLKNQDLADVMTYERNAWGNDTKTLVKPEDIKE